ncbi:MAG: Dyp-type peroxidase [Acidimicrobiales bacterium]
MGPAAVTGAGAGLDLGGMQGLVARAYGHQPFSRYLFLAIGDPAAARRWVGELLPEVDTAAHRPSGAEPGTCVNVAFTCAGLERLGLGADALATFPRPLAEGIVTGHRSRILGDVGPNAPSGWRWGGPATPAVHVLVLLYAATREALDAATDGRRAAWTAGGALSEAAPPIDGRILDPPGVEHFGFADGLSQPVVKGWPGAEEASSTRPPAPVAPIKWTQVNPGEVVLGCDDNFGTPAEGPTVGGRSRAGAGLPVAPWARGRRHLGHAGTWLVARQLAQDVAGFRRYVQEAGVGPGSSPELLAAKMVGRWPNGAPLVLAPDHEDPAVAAANDFGYHVDQYGVRCPVGAHIRRSNPRDSSADHPERARKSTLNHRILRRGRSYGLQYLDPPTRPGEEAGAERGLMFLCLNTDVERQFEFVQGTWLANRSFGGLYGEVDPVTGNQPEGGGRFTRPADPVRRPVTGLPSFVTVRGGGYFFLPGLAALRYLAAMQG